MGGEAMSALSFCSASCKKFVPQTMQPPPISSVSSSTNLASNKRLVRRHIVRIVRRRPPSTIIFIGSSKPASMPPSIWSFALSARKPLVLETRIVNCSNNTSESNSPVGILSQPILKCAASVLTLLI